MGSNPGRVNFFIASCSHHVVNIHYIKQSVYQSCKFFEDLLQYTIVWTYSKWRSCQSPPHKCIPLPCWYYWLQEIKKAWIYGSLQWHNVHTKFNSNLSSGSRAESCRLIERQTDRNGQPDMCSFHAHHAKNTQKLYIRLGSQTANVNHKRTATHNLIFQYHVVNVYFFFTAQVCM
jgi:hypothetical protein